MRSLVISQLQSSQFWGGKQLSSFWTVEVDTYTPHHVISYHSFKNWKYFLLLTWSTVFYYCSIIIISLLLFEMAKLYAISHNLADHLFAQS